MELEDLYQEIILDHYRSPRNHSDVLDRGKCVKHENPLCGDELYLKVDVDEAGGKIANICFSGHGCSISQASASMITEAVKGLDKDKALEISEKVRRLMRGEAPAENLGDIEALQGVSKFPVRVKCALLAWMALRDALTNGKGQTEKKDECN
ncbi:MAG TPA: SUF system NifU family Fe-S cluster assembly protein [Candidatus Glassbacteria bacterium]|nr:SUF system NifU family Fe-S cluster assembly protein [Candidatus Glassbacteria bacterium]